MSLTRKQKFRKLRELLKQHGLSGRLYYGNKKVAWSYYSNYVLNNLIHNLSFFPGQTVQDCDVFNHVLKRPIIRYQQWGRWYSVNSNKRNPVNVLFMDQWEFEDGQLSCGCPKGLCPAAKPEDINAYFRGFLDDPELKQNGWTEGSYYEKINEVLISGGSIVDNEGRLLPEIRKIRFGE